MNQREGLCSLTAAVCLTCFILNPVVLLSTNYSNTSPLSVSSKESLDGTLKRKIQKPQAATMKEYKYVEHQR